MTIQERAANWINEVGRTQAIIDCKRAIEKFERHIDRNGYTPSDLQHLREYREILKELKNHTTNE
jgi:hypothetical protein